jgi:hypothetical protein
MNQACYYSAIPQHDPQPHVYHQQLMMLHQEQKLQQLQPQWDLHSNLPQFHHSGMTWPNARNAPAEYASQLMYWPAHQLSGGGGGLPFPSDGTNSARLSYPPPPETRLRHPTPELAPPEQLPFWPVQPSPDPVAAAPFGLGAHHRGGPMVLYGTLQQSEPIGSCAVGIRTAAEAALAAAAFAAMAVAAAAPFVAPFIRAKPLDHPPSLPSAAAVAAQRSTPSLQAIAFADSLAADFGHLAPPPQPTPQPLPPTLAVDDKGGGDANQSLSKKSHKRAIEENGDDDETREQTCLNARNIRHRNTEQV